MRFKQMLSRQSAKKWGNQDWTKTCDRWFKKTSDRKNTHTQVASGIIGEYDPPKDLRSQKLCLTRLVFHPYPIIVRMETSLEGWSQKKKRVFAKQASACFCPLPNSRKRDNISKRKQHLKSHFQGHQTINAPRMQGRQRNLRLRVLFTTH